MRVIALALVAAAVCATAGMADGGLTTYRDPGGVFTIDLPDGWTQGRQDMGTGIFLTTCASPDEGSEVVVLVIPSAQQLKPEQLEATAEQVIESVLGFLKQAYTVEGKAPEKARLGGMDAVRVDAVLTEQLGGGKSLLRMYVVLGGKNAVAAAVTVPQAGGQGLAAGDKLLATLTVEGAALAAGGGKPGGAGGVFSRVADRMKVGYKAESADKVLAEGNPPLTEGSVRDFATLLTAVFGVHLTESEFALTRERFIHFYQQTDDAGQATIAQTAGSILASLEQATPEERNQGIAEVRAVFEDRLSTGAKAGIEWAQVLWEAVQRRGEVVAKASAEAPKFARGQDEDNTLSEADLDATMELLYFMWVASGRDPNAATPEVVATLRQYLAQSFPALSPDLQYLMTNAEKVYGQMRNAWAQAGPDEQAVYAQQFGQALDAFGLSEGGGGGAGVGNGGGGGGSAWDDCAGMSASDISAGLMQTTCYNLAQKSSGGW